jgi:hypothetical protein
MVLEVIGTGITLLGIGQSIYLTFPLDDRGEPSCGLQVKAP